MPRANYLCQKKKEKQNSFCIVTMGHGVPETNRINIHVIWTGFTVNTCRQTPDQRERAVNTIATLWW